MIFSIRFHHVTQLLMGLVIVMIVAPSLAAELIVDGSFENQKNGAELRKDSKGSDWYESRKDTEEGSSLLMLSLKDVGGNATKKAMIKASPTLNTYLSHRLTASQDLAVTVTFDIFIKEILPTDNRSAFILLGAITDKKGGPNSTGKERFVFLGFENAAEEGHLNLFAREGSTTWDEKTIVAGGLKLGQWYTITIEANIPEGVYTTAVKGETEPFELESFYTKGATPGKITHISFASWNDGAGTFYVDNVSVQN
jgi:hypothetical protein